MIRAAVDLALKCGPDAICLTGDFVTGNDADPDALAELLAPLARRAPTFATLGNHDGGAWARWRHEGYKDTQAMRAMLAAAGITHLDNTAETLTLRGRAVRFCGVGDLWAGEFRPHKVLAREQPTEPTVLLSHNPDTKDGLQPFGWHLLLAGHTHGGQLRVPLFGAPFVPVRDKRFVRGLHRWENRWLAVSAGVGNLHGARFNCRPEISELTLV
jgi:predicted MPP superfamily phosphohydrolase